MDAVTRRSRLGYALAARSEHGESAQVAIPALDESTCTFIPRANEPDPDGDAPRCSPFGIPIAE
jgi:hypothetical protein